MTGFIQRTKHWPKRSLKVVGFLSRPWRAGQGEKKINVFVKVAFFIDTLALLISHERVAF